MSFFPNEDPNCESREIERSKSIFDRTLQFRNFVSEIAFSKYFSFDSRVDVINPKLGQKGPKLVFHVPMVIERWKSIVKKVSVFETIILKFWSFAFPRLLHQPKNRSKRSEMVLDVLMMPQKWKSKLKGTLGWIICLWNPSVKVLKFWLNMVTSSTQNLLETNILAYIDLEVNVFPSKFLKIVFLIILSLFARDVQIRTFLD